jgi:CheY-like chemotaxis protein
MEMTKTKGHEMKTILVVDDENIFRKRLAEGLSSLSKDYKVLTAENGKEAVAVLATENVDLVITDIHMPEMDGFELLAYMNAEHRNTQAIVMTAFGTLETARKVTKLGAIRFLDKPLDLKVLANTITDVLTAGSDGRIQGITLASFLQLVEMEKKTCTLTIKAGDQVGILHILKGVMMNAESGDLKGIEAAFDIVSWDDTVIDISNQCRVTKDHIKKPLNFILMEAFRLKDEANKNKTKGKGEESAPKEKRGGGKAVAKDKTTKAVSASHKEVNIMSVQDKLKDLAALDGFGGVAIFTPTGETLAQAEANGGNADLRKVGVLANNVLLNAQKASIDMGTGRGQLVHVEAEKAHIIVRCMNEGTDPLKSQPGKDETEFDCR